MDHFDRTNAKFVCAKGVACALTGALMLALALNYANAGEAGAEGLGAGFGNDGSNSEPVGQTYPDGPVHVVVLLTGDNINRIEQVLSSAITAHKNGEQVRLIIPGATSKQATIILRALLAERINLYVPRLVEAVLRLDQNDPKQKVELIDSVTRELSRSRRILELVRKEARDNERTGKVDPSVEIDLRYWEQVTKNYDRFRKTLD